MGIQYDELLDCVLKLHVSRFKLSTREQVDLQSKLNSDQHAQYIH